MPNGQAGDPGNRRSTIADLAGSAGPGSVDGRHLLLVGADLQPDGIRVATLTIAGQIVAGTSFDPERIAERYWEVVHADGPWQAEFRFTGE
jgi:hypothetical protein